MTEFHPVEITDLRDANVPAEVALRAYEVYCHIHGPQPAMVDLAGRNCRGGFGVGELIAFLYARSFPKDEWRARADQAFARAECRR
jgi:hypothetical protein